MFFIVNKTKGHITLGDIGVTLGPRQAVDLDKIMGRNKSEESQALKKAQQRGDIEIRVKDKLKSHSIQNTQKLTATNDLGSMKKEIIVEMKDTMKELLQGQGGGVSKADLQELIDAMPKSSETVIIRQEGGNIREDEEVEMDEGIMGEMNIRAVSKMVENVVGVDIKCDEENQKNDLMDNVNELENLLFDN